MSTITVRRPSFDWPDDLPILAIPTDHARSCELIGLSFTLPYLEPYLIRTMRAAAKQVEDADLRADMKAFNGQEAQHYRNHATINDIVREQLSEAAGEEMQDLEDRLEADYRRFTDEKSLAFNLAYAEGFEAMTFALARSHLRSADAPELAPEWAGLWAWHLCEEIEHRTVTFDAYEQVVGKYPYRVAVGTWAQAHFLRHLLAMAIVAQNDLGGPEVGMRTVAWEAAKRNWRNGTIRGVLGAMSPRYNPRYVKIPENVRTIAQLQGIDLG